MNVHQTSTNKSTNYEKQIVHLENELSLAKSASAKKETIQAIKKRLKKITSEAQNEKDWRDIRKIADWPDKILIQRYEESLNFADKLDIKLNDLDLLNNKKLTENANRYFQVLKVIKTLEDEGNKRQLAYFLSEEEIETIFNDTNGPTPTRVTNSEGRKQ